MAGRFVIPFLVGMMLLTGVCNTLLTKYQDLQCVANCDPHDRHRRRTFEQPVWQTVQMFIGESGCWLVVGASALVSRYRNGSGRGEYAPLFADNEGEADVVAATEPANAYEADLKPLKGWRVTLLALPAIADICGTTLMNVGLLLVAASIYQMTRGALVLFVGLFSVWFLKRHLPLFKWVSLFLVVFGVAIVGLAGAIQQRHKSHDQDASSPDLHHDGLLARMLDLGARAVYGAADEVKTPAVSPALTVLGVLMIAGAQIFTATQFVLEESIMARYSTAPLVVVGWEGVFGFVVTVTLQFAVHLAYGRTERGRGSYFDATTGWHEMTHNRAVAVTSLLIMLSIGGFNYFGLSVTRSVSATSRSTIDTCRTLFIWVVSLGLGWESFKWLQVVGFAFLVYGTFLFNDIVRPPRLGRRGGAGAHEVLPERPVEHS